MTGPNALAFAVAQVGVASSGNELLAKAIDITKKATQAHGRDLVDWLNKRKYSPISAPEAPPYLSRTDVTIIITFKWTKSS
jgi:hypothetical protein